MTAMTARTMENYSKSNADWSLNARKVSSGASKMNKDPPKVMMVADSLSDKSKELHDRIQQAKMNLKEIFSAEF
jgi:hypothetical protein